MSEILTNLKPCTSSCSRSPTSICSCAALFGLFLCRPHFPFSSLAIVVLNVIRSLGTDTGVKGLADP